MAALIALLAAWILLIVFAEWARHAPIRNGDLLGQSLYRLVQLHVRLVHGLRVEGLENVPDRQDPTDDSPLVIVSNHAAGIDPLLIQAALPFEVTWIMAIDMREASLESLWSYAKIIFVDRRTGESMGLRAALRVLKSNGVIGVFPEGHIERPARVLLPFESGAGLIVARSGARVLPVVIEGAPLTESAWASLFIPSRSRIRFLPPIDYAAAKIKPADIAPDLRHRYAQATGWPMTNRRYGFVNGVWVELTHP
ncbi:MAG TPA: lysophospholipid acyltransferase family protein [Phycisphaerales bacterium]|nr:lysophospholipid acyltransferase family protein [Phycisphaerales bacterium]